MNSGDQYKVLEIRTLKGMPGEEQAHQMLDKIAKQVQPIMRKHEWTECGELLAKGITGSGGEGFDLPGRRLGGSSRQPPLSSLRKAALAAAQKISQLGSFLPSGPIRIGGDSFIMKALIPGQAAAMAAERRLQDELWCGSQSYDPSDHEDVNNESSKNLINKQNNVGSSRPTDNSTLAMDLTSRKRSRDKDSSLPVHSSSNPNFVDLTMDTPKIGRVNEHQSGSHRRSFGLDSQLNTHARSTSANLSSSSGSLSGDNRPLHYEEPALWQCLTCTLLNNSPICELCGTQQPKDVTTKHNTWSCKFCTLENSAKLERCSACDEWR